MITRGQAFRRRGNGDFEPRGAEFDVLSAGGGWYEGRIGYGKLTAPVEQIIAAGVEPDDLVCVWQHEFPLAPMRVAQFIVQSKQYENGKTELSGPNYLAALNDMVMFDPIGERTTVSSIVEGFRPHPDNDLAPAAAYAPRVYQSGSGAPPGAGDTYFVTHGKVLARVGDVMTIDFSTDLVARPIFVTTITDVSDGNTRLSFADGLPYELPPLTPFTLTSTMINVADASVFTIGEEVRIGYSPDGYNPLIINRIKDTQVVPNNSDYIELETYFALTIPIGAYAMGVSYSNPTYTDVETLLEVATGGVWRVNRSPMGYPGATYDPNGETVFQVLQALSEMTGWSFRLNMNDAGLTPRNEIDYFPPGRAFPHPTTLDMLGTWNLVRMNYGEIIEISTEEGYASATHVIPFGGGSGDTRFGITDSTDLFDILATYVDGTGQPRFSWGHDGRRGYIFDRTAVTRNWPTRWKVVTFDYIYPENEASITDRREAANALVWAACEWLVRNGFNSDVTYKVTCHTLADPRPGDRIEMVDYSSVETFPVVRGGLYIAEVHHEVNEPSGLRMTKLVLTPTGSHYLTGEDMTAQAIRGIQRRERIQNAVHRGSARVDYDGTTFRGDATMTATTGTMSLSTNDDDIVLDSGGAVVVRGDGLDVRTNVSSAGVVRAAAGADLPDDEGDYWNTQYIVVRGVPRMVTRG